MDFETYKQARLSGLSPEEAFAQKPVAPAQPVVPSTPAPAQPQQGGFSVAKTIGNIPRSAGEFLGGIGHAVLHPMDTIGNVAELATGAIEKLIPGKQAEEQAFDSVTSFYKNRYGSVNQFLKTVQEDPVGVLSDASVFLTGGGALLSKVGKVSKLAEISKAGQVVSKVGELTNPLKPLGKLTSQAQEVFPWAAKQLEKNNLRLTPTKAGALATEGLDLSAPALDLTKNRLNEVAEWLAKEKITGNPTARYAKAGQLVEKTEGELDKFFSSMSKGSGIKPQDVTRSINNLKAIYRGERDFPAIEKQLAGAVKSVNTLPKNAQGLIPFDFLNKFKRSTYKNAYNRAGEKVVDGVEHSIGDAIRGMQDERLRGLKINGVPFEKFNHNYGLLLESRKLLKTAIGKPEITAAWRQILGGGMGYLIGAFTGGIGAPIGGAVGLATGENFLKNLPATALRSHASKSAQILGELKVPQNVGGLLPSKIRGALPKKLVDTKIPSIKTPLTAVERINESQQ